MYRLLLVSSAVVVITALPQPPATAANSIDSSFESAARSMKKDCTGGIFSSTCLKIEAISVLEKLSAKDELPLLHGISVVKDASDNGSKAEQVAAELARSLPGKPEERLDKYLLYRLGTYLDTHSVKLRLLDAGAAEEARSAIGEARKGGGIGGGGGGKKGGGMGSLIGAALMMKGTLMSVGLGGLALLAGKALMTALMSLMLSAIIGLKALTSGGGKSTTYEIVTKPVYSHSHSHSTGHEDVGYGHSGGGGGHYGRSIDAMLRRR